MTDKAKQPKPLWLESRKRDILTLSHSPGSDRDTLRLAAQLKLSRTPFREMLHQAYATTDRTPISMIF